MLFISLVNDPLLFIQDYQLRIFANKSVVFDCSFFPLEEELLKKGTIIRSEDLIGEIKNRSNLLLGEVTKVVTVWVVKLNNWEFPMVL